MRGGVLKHRGITDGRAKMGTLAREFGGDSGAYSVARTGHQPALPFNPSSMIPFPSPPVPPACPGPCEFTNPPVFPASVPLPDRVEADSYTARVHKTNCLKQGKKMTESLLELTARIVSAHVTNNAVAAEALPTLIREVFNALTSASDGTSSVPEPEVEVEEAAPPPAPPPPPAAAAPPAPVSVRGPAVPVARSVFENYIVCLEDGKKMTMLKRHLMTEHNLTVDQYRAKWDLPANYPMVAPSYAETRSALAKQMGLGHSRTIASRKPGRPKRGD